MHPSTNRRACLSRTGGMAVLTLVTAAALVSPTPGLGETLSISPAAFQANSTTDESIMNGVDGFRRSLEDGCEFAPVQLPDGAVLNHLVFWVRDQDPDDDVTLQLWEKNTTNNTAAVKVLVGSSFNTSPLIRVFLGFPPGSAHNVDTTNEMFYLEACFGAADLELHHIAIDYTGPAAGIDTGSPHVIPAAAFRTVRGRRARFAAGEGTIAANRLEGGWPDECFVAPVNLPQGTHVDELQAVLWDSDPDNDFNLQLRRKRLNGSPSQLVGIVGTTGQSGLQSLSASVAGTVVDHAYAYYLATTGNCPVSPDAGTPPHRIFGARIVHTQALFADGFESGDTDAWDGGTRGSSTVHRLLVPAAAFLPAKSKADFGHFVDPLQGRTEFDDTWVDNRCLVAPITLPNGAALWAMTSYLIDPDSSRDYSVTLYRKTHDAPSATPLATASTGVSFSGGSTARINLLSGTVDAVEDHYYLEACDPVGSAAGDFGIQSVLIDYDPAP